MTKPIKSRIFNYEYLIGYTTPQRYSDHLRTDRPWNFDEKKIFRVALARFGSVLPVTPVPLCGPWLIVKRLWLCIVGRVACVPSCGGYRNAKIEFCINMQRNYLKITHLPLNMQTLCIILHKYANCIQKLQRFILK